MTEKQDTTQKEAAIAQAYAAYLRALAARDLGTIKAPVANRCQPAGFSPVADWLPDTDSGGVSQGTSVEAQSELARKRSR